MRHSAALLLYIVIFIILISTLLSMKAVDSVEKHHREVQRNINGYKRKARLRFIRAVITSPVRYTRNYLQNAKELDSRGWYKNLGGGWTDSHGADVLFAYEICRLEPEEFLKTHFRHDWEREHS